MLEIIAGTNFHFIGQWIAVAWRTAFDYICDPDIRAGHTGLFKQLIQKLSRCPHEWASLLIFTSTGTLTDQHDFSMSWTFPRDRIFAGTMQFAFGADHNLPGKLFQLLFIAHSVPPYPVSRAHRQR